MTYLDAGVCCLPNSRQQVIVPRVRRPSKCTVHNPAVDMHPNIDLEHIVLVQRHLIPRVWRVVRRAVVPAQARRKAHATLEAVALLEPHVARQVAHSILDALGNLRQRRAGLDELLAGPGAHLAVHDGALAVLAHEVFVESFEVALLLTRRAVGVFVDVGDLLAWRIRAVGV